MTRVRIAAVHVALPLLLGALSYVILRSRVPMLGAHVALWPAAPHMLRDHFADAAWGWALGGFVSMMWFDQKRSHRIAWTCGAMLVAAGYEVLLGGRFDRIDLVAQTSAVAIAALMVGGMGWVTSKEAR